MDQLTHGTASWSLENNARDSLNSSLAASSAFGSWKSFAADAAAPANSSSSEHWAPKIGELLAQQELLRLIASVLSPRDLRSNGTQAVVRLPVLDLCQNSKETLRRVYCCFGVEEPHE